MTQAKLDSFLRETITLWPVAFRDHRGQPAFAAPLTIKARWEDVEERFVNDAGEAEQSRALVFVDRVVEKGARLFHGISSSTEPESLPGTFLVKQYRQDPSLYDPAVVLREVVL